MFQMDRVARNLLAKPYDKMTEQSIKTCGAFTGGAIQMLIHQIRHSADSPNIRVTSPPVIMSLDFSPFELSSPCSCRLR